MKSIERWFLTDTRMGASTTTSKSVNHAIDAGNRYHRRIYKLLTAHCAMTLPDWKLLVEPWFKSESQKLRSPDAVLQGADCSLVIEVKKNWGDGKDTKLLDEYVPLVKSAFDKPAFPLMIVGNVRGLPHKPFLSMADLLSPLTWRPGQPTPTLLKL